MAYCPSCAHEITSTENQCPNCGANFAAADGWKPLDAPPPTEPQTRGLKWWQKVLWFIGFYIIGLNVTKHLGVDAVTQLFSGVAAGFFGAMLMNARARNRQAKQRAA